MLMVVSEDNIDQVLYFVYNMVFIDGEIWNVIIEDGEDVLEFKMFLIKVVFGWYSFYGMDYMGLFVDEVLEFVDFECGFFLGCYEVDGELN